MKNFKISVLLIIFSSLFLTSCNKSKSLVDLDIVLKIASTNFEKIESHSKKYEESKLMELFLSQFEDDLNQATPKLYAKNIGVSLESNGSILGFSDDNYNGKYDSKEQKLFSLEVDAENNRLLASEGERVREYRHRSHGGGFFTGMLIGSLLSRQRTSGVNTRNLSSRRATAKVNTKPKSSTRKGSSAKSRSRSGSYSRGK